MPARMVLGAVLLLTLTGRPLRAAVSETLTSEEIGNAIRLGQSGDPSPYPIYNPGEPRPGAPRGLVMAVVYTPFIRVALAAKVARDNGRDFTPDDVTADLTKPVAYVAYRWYCCVDPRVHGEDKMSWDPYREPFDYRIATETDGQIRIGSPKFPRAPLLVTRDLSSLTRFGDRLRYDDLVLLAVYPIRELTGARFRDLSEGIR